MQDVFKLEDTKESANKQLIEKYGEGAVNKISKIQGFIKRGISFSEACYMVNVDEEGFQKIMDGDKIVSRLIKSAEISYRASFYDDIRQNGNSKDKLSLLEMTTGVQDDSGSPLEALVKHIQDENQGSSLVSDRINGKL